jgi:hypothetical protein
MTRNAPFLAIVIACLLSCKQIGIRYTKYDPGLCYRIVEQGDGKTVQHGEVLKLHMKQTYRDSLLNDNTDSVPFYQVHDSIKLSKAAYALFSKVRKGDSIIFKALTDSVFKHSVPPFVRRGEWMYTHVYVKDVMPAGYKYEKE